MGNLKKKSFKKVYDLQNSSRTKFYKNILFPKANFNFWSSSETTLPSNISKEEFERPLHFTMNLNCDQVEQRARTLKRDDFDDFDRP